MTEQGDRGFIDWAPRSDTEQLVNHILSVVHYYRDNGYPAPTVRDVYYDLLGWYGADFGYVKGDAFKRRVYRLLSKMRRSRMIDFDDINDDSSDSLVTSTHRDPTHFWRDVTGRAQTYHKSLAHNQPQRVIVFTEGAGAVRQFYEVAKDYTIPVYSPGGWDSITLKYETAARAVSEYERRARPTVVLHTGDFDPDGMELFRCFTEDVFAFVEDSGEEPEDVITFKRVMLVAEQIPEEKKTIFSHAELKKKNYRGQRWPYDFKAELQALSLEHRLPILREAIEAEVDHAQLEEDRAASEEEYRRVQETTRRITGGN